MKILCAPFETVLGKPQENAKTALDILLVNKTTDYILFPPLFLTGATCGALFEYGFFIAEQDKAFKEVISAMPGGVKCISSIMRDGEEVPVVFDNSGIINDESVNVALGIKGVKEDKTNFLCLKHKWTVGSIDELLWKLKGTKAFFTSCGLGESSARCVYSGACGAVDGDFYKIVQDRAVLFDGGKPDKPIKKPNAFPNSKYPFVPEDDKYLDDAIAIMKRALRRRLNHLGSDKMVIGVSGGLDSTLALLVAAETVSDRRNIIGITMPGLGTTDKTKGNAEKLMELLGVTSRKISISKAVYSHFEDIGHEKDVYDVAYENAQARERMQILFDISNMEGALNVGTGDLSEAMLGFTTFGGDHLSMYNVNCGVPKTLVRALVLRFAKRMPSLAEVLTDIAKTPISPELLPTAQETEKIVGDYTANDFAIYHTLVNRAGRKELEALLKNEGFELDLDMFYKRITSAQFKRNCSADGVQVVMCSAALGGDFDLPSDVRNVF